MKMISILSWNLQESLPSLPTQKILKAGMDLIPASTGAFANEELLNSCKAI